MEIKELGHLVLYVRDLERSAHFYRDVLGWRQVLPDPDGESTLPFPAAMFSAPSNRTHHELLLIEVGADAAPVPPGRRVGMYHFGLKIGDSDDELREALRRLADNGVEVLGASDH
ncbi:MAG: VOC family protein, partial [Streptosporangiales bacterium]|nr:VOC family protein [Streptosporangiales bacterium]